MTIRCLAAVLLFLGACASDNGAPSARSTPCPSTSTLEDTSVLPRDLPMDALTEVVAASVRKGFLTARGVTETSIVELYPQLSRALLDEGYDILNGDNEGFEAEIFFRRGRGTTGTYLLREGPCEGQVTLTLLYGSKRYRDAS